MEDERKTKKQLIEELNCLRNEQIEQTIITSEKFTKAFLQNSIPTIITSVKDSSVVEVSDAFLRLVGLKRHEIIGNTAVKGGFITKEQREIFFNELNKNGHIENLEMEVRPGNGELRHGLFNSVMISINNENCALTTIHDITERKKMEKALRDSEEKFRLLFNSGKDYLAVHLTGKDGQPGRFIQVNDAACEILGYTREEMLKLTHHDVDSAKSSGHMPALIEKLIKNKHILYETEIVTKNGDKIPMEVSLNLFSLNGNRATMCVARDITARKQADKELHLSEIKYRTLHQSMMDAFVSVDMAGNIRDYNKSYLDMLGYGSEEINNLTYKDITPEKWHMIEDEILKKQILTEGYSHIYEKEYRRKDGTVFPVELRTVLMLDTEGVPIGMWAIVRDITERKLAGEILAKSHEKYRLIAENIMDCIALVSKDGIIQYVSNALEPLGYEPEELMNIKGLSITHPDDMERIKTLYRQGIENAWREIAFEMKVRHKNGHYIPMAVRGRTLFDLHGKVMGGFFVARFTEPQKAEITLLDQKSSYNLTDLSPREKEILNWVMEGKTTWDIAKIIYIAESTVKFHIDKIMKKLNAVNRTHAVAIAIRHELLK